MVEEVLSLKNNSKIKRAVIAGASEALRMKEKSWQRKDEEILQEITNRMNDILEKID